MVVNIFIEGLECLEYRGYDFVGIVMVIEGKIELVWVKGKLFNFKEKLENYSNFFCLGIGYICWVIYGKLEEYNVYFYLDN